VLSKLSTARHSSSIIISINKWSKYFGERPHRISCRYWGLNDFLRGMPLLTIAWSFCCVHRSRDSRCFSMGRTTSKKCPFPWKISIRSNTWFLWPTRVSLPTEYRSVQLFLQGSLTWPTDRQTDRHRHIDRPCYSVRSNRPHLSIAALIR